MKRYDLVIIGAGPAGLSAAIEAARRGLSVIVFDENARPGGQLFKQIHKFFGSKAHRAKIRGYKIGEELLKEASDAGVTVQLSATAAGLYPNRELLIQHDDEIRHYRGDAVIIATGAAENAVPFEGWTLPGVIGAGAAQTMMNLHGIRPGDKILMLGSGNVGLVVGYQLLQAGCELTAVVDAAPRIGGYGVHAAKLARCGVPFYLSHTILKAEGTDRVTGVTICAVDEHFKPVPGTEQRFDVDTICMAVGLSPMSQLLNMAGCKMDKKGGQVPVTDAYGETSVPRVFATGDVSGIEEASSAMIEGKISGIRASFLLGYADKSDMQTSIDSCQNDLNSLREGMFAPGNKGKLVEKTEEGIPVSMTLLTKGYIGENELERFPGISGQKGIHPVIECTQNIPCNPCQDACTRHCIKIGAHITSLPVVENPAPCTGCGLCVAACSGQAIFLVNENSEPGFATVTLPYEFLPLPRKGERGTALDRSGHPVCEAEITEIRSSKAFDHTNLLTMKVPADMVMKARFFKTYTTDT